VIRLHELHSTEISVLEKNMGVRASIPGQKGNRPPRQQQGPRVMIEYSDGFAALKAALPPPQRRGLVLIDPSYENKQDYQTTLTAIKEGLARFPIGMYAIWYPQLQRSESKRFPEQLLKLAGDLNWLHASLTVSEPSADGLGLYGSGMFILNPPWTLPEQLKQALPYLVKTLGLDKGAEFGLQYQIK
jgi:23S rRNA (adenine2030-N6)-methyltransferase